MYCSKCGFIITPGQNKCPECNSDMREIEYNGGFWDMVGETPEPKTKIRIAREVPERPASATTTPPTSQAPISSVSKPAEAPTGIRKSHIVSIVFIAATVVLLIVSIAFGVCALIIHGKYSDEVSNRERLEAELEEVLDVEPVDFTNEEYKALQQENEELGQQLEELKQQLEEEKAKTLEQDEMNDDIIGGATVDDNSENDEPEPDDNEEEYEE